MLTEIYWLRSVGTDDEDWRRVRHMCSSGMKQILMNTGPDPWDSVWTVMKHKTPLIISSVSKHKISPHSVLQPQINVCMKGGWWVMWAVCRSHSCGNTFNKICLGRRDCDCEVGFTIFCLLHDTSELIAITFTANLWMNQMVTKHHVFAAHCWYLVMFYMLMTIAGPGQGQLTDPKQNECSKQIFDLEKLRMINWASWDTVITLSVSWEKCLFAKTMWEMSDVKLFSWNYYLTSVKQMREEPLPHAFTALHSLVSPPALASIIISIQVSLLSVSWATFYQQQSGCHICTWWRHDARDCVISRCDFQSILWIVNCGL